MLKFWNSETYITSAEGGPLGYVVYQDDELPQKFYIAPKRPTIAINESKKLSFLFRKYRFSTDPATNAKEIQRRQSLGLGGAYVVFDVVLRVPEVAQADILEQIKKKYGIKLGKASAAGLAAQGAAKAAADAPGDAGKQLAAQQAQAAFAAAMKSTDGIPSVDDIQIAAIPFGEGNVQLNISAANDPAFVQSITTLGKPAKDGNNTASFSAELTVDGATFFANALNSQSGGAIQVLYSMKTWFRSSDTLVTASYHKDNALKYDQVIKESTGKTIWNEGSYNNTIDQMLQKNEIVDIKVTWGSGSYTDEQTQSIRKWAFDAVADAVKRQLGDYTSPTDQGSVNTGGGGHTTERHYDLKQTSDFSQSYRESFAMLMDVNPQGLLPNIGSMKDPSDPTGKTFFKWDDYYKEVDLDDPFFKNLGLGVSCDLDFSTSPVNRVEVELWYSSKQSDSSNKDYHTTLSFTGADAARKTWSPYGTEQAYSYQYTIYFKNGTHYVSAKLQATTKELVIASTSEGIVTVDVIANGFSAATIRQCLLGLTVVDRTTNKRGPNTSVILTNSALQQRIQLPVGNDFQSPYTYEYTREYTLEPDGKRITVPAAISGGSQLLVLDPFPDYRVVKLAASSLGEGDTVFVELTYSEGQYLRTATKTLSSDNPASTWTFGVYNRSQGVLSYSGTFDRKVGGELAIPETKAKGDSIVLKPSAGESTDFTVTIDPSMLRWSALGLTKVEVAITYNGRTKTQIFRTAPAANADPPTQTWPIADDGSTTYTYKVKFYGTKDGADFSSQTPPQDSDDPELTVPNPVAAQA
jgi:hypothetical protein